MPLHLDRRLFLGSSGAAALGGCATTSPRGFSRDCRPLAPVIVDRSRLIRAVAGLRPYRPSGFVVRAEALGDKRLVHNYGHGGAGITLSWGSARLATDLGLAGHTGAVAVIGAGVMGLSTARLVQDAGFPVTIYAAALPPETTSNVAGGQFHPFGHFRSDAVTPAWREQFRRAADYSWRRFQLLVGDDYGVRWLPTFNQGSPEEPMIEGFPPVNRRLDPHEHPFPVANVTRYDTLYVETGRYLRQLTRDFHDAGGRIVVRRFAVPAELAAMSESLVFNCTGLGARELFGDRELIPVRGQLAVLLPQPEVRYALTMEAGYMFPRPDGIILGGTFERGVEDASPEPATVERIISRHRELFSQFRCSLDSARSSLI